ncbi:hypothetical protein DPMN_117698 [Dreissena polymorpha]|uniref:Uncharacterized protein n=1 Tax=Dreissena polymorpha TaxID=45954 RepID=A0A9D4JQG2_DREPO|nr:hypothetical protein DPMN_117698 [Dreissena polymorpha]
MDMTLTPNEKLLETPPPSPDPSLASLNRRGDLSCCGRKKKTNHHTEEQDELNDIQIRLPTLHRTSRSSLNAVDNPLYYSGNRLIENDAKHEHRQRNVARLASSNATKQSETLNPVSLKSNFDTRIN